MMCWSTCATAKEARLERLTAHGCATVCSAVESDVAANPAVWVATPEDQGQATTHEHRTRVLLYQRVTTKPNMSSSKPKVLLHQLSEHVVAGVNWRPLRLVADVPREHVCEHCHVIPRETALLPCKHALCDLCHEASTSAGETVCPIDRQSCGKDELRMIPLPETISNSLKAHCWNEDKGCDFSGTLETLLRHYETECEYRSIPCSVSRETVLLKNLPAHCNVDGCIASGGAAAASAGLNPTLDAVPSVESITDAVEERKRQLVEIHSCVSAMQPHLEKLYQVSAKRVQEAQELQRQQADRERQPEGGGFFRSVGSSIRRSFRRARQAASFRQQTPRDSESVRNLVGSVDSVSQSTRFGCDSSFLMAAGETSPEGSAEADARNILPYVWSTYLYKAYGIAPLGLRCLCRSVKVSIIRRIKMYYACAIVTSCVLLHAAALEDRLAPSVFGRALFPNDKCSPQPGGKSIGERATCRFTTTVDVDTRRVPAKLPVVRCNCPGNLCHSNGDYRCQEVRRTFRVAYRLRLLGARRLTVFEKALFANDMCAPQPRGASIGERATCTFTTTVDVDATRVPAELPVVKCNCPGNLCRSDGDYRCQEVRSTFRVAYRGGTELVNGTVELTTSCVCAVSRTAVAGGGDRISNVNKSPS
ncbi:hypothetical protein HPB52_024433 [Rhipicephalus sanguineus]|uniref:RING-type domain-containing protein n=1 Tax=Rhipicephalus sanguineus TaxID=34632 RepID=A0A9D4TCB4_RHISA|nr:hypothetical protein HPB52_024433 [Rhipicephalus sanguineus]